MSECDGRDGYIRMIRDRGNLLKNRREQARKATPDRVQLELVAHVAGDIVTMQCGAYRLVYGIERQKHGVIASYLPLRSLPIPGIDPSAQAIMGAAADAYVRSLSWHS